MSWPGAKHVYVRSIENKRAKTSDIGYVTLAGMDVEVSCSRAARRFSSNLNCGIHILESSFKLLEDSSAYTDVALGPMAGSSAPWPAQRAHSAPLSDLFLDLDEQFAPTTPPMLRQCPFASPLASSPRDDVMARQPWATTSSQVFASCDLVSKVGPTSGLPTEAFARCGRGSPPNLHAIDKAPDLGSNTSSAYAEATGISKPTTPTPRKELSTPSLQRHRPPPLLPLHAAPHSGAADAYPPLVTVDLGDVNHPPPPPSPPPPFRTSAVPAPLTPLVAAAAVDKSVAAAAAASPPLYNLLWPPYDLNQSALWRAGDPLGRPPLPDTWRARMRSPSPTSSLSSGDLFTSIDLGAPTTTTAAATTGASPSAVPIRSRGGTASPFGLAWEGPLELTSGRSSSAGSLGGSRGGGDVESGTFGYHDGFDGATDGSSSMRWGGSDWIRRCSPFAQLATAAAGCEADGDDEAGGAYLMAAITGTAAAGGAAGGAPPPSKHLLPPRPASPCPPGGAGGGGDPHGWHGGCQEGEQEGGDGVAAPARPPPPMDDEELDEYYLNTLCGGHDPIAAFMQQERARVQQLEREEGEGEEWKKEVEEEERLPRGEEDGCEEEVVELLAIAPCEADVEEEQKQPEEFVGEEEEEVDVEAAVWLLPAAAAGTAVRLPASLPPSPPPPAPPLPTPSLRPLQLLLRQDTPAALE
ncbi:hypothetical protein Agub_g11359, partial [Astrephomene gubernaculifera]